MAKPSLPLAPRPPVAPPEPERVANTKPSALIHLARTPAQANAANGMVAPTEQSAYGYGLELSLGHEELSKLGMQAPPPVGSKIRATVEMHVNSAANDPTVGGKPRNRATLTVTHMKVHGERGAPAAVVKRAPGSAPPKKGRIAVAAHVRRAPAPKRPTARGAFVKPPTVKRA